MVRIIVKQLGTLALAGAWVMLLGCETVGGPSQSPVAPHSSGVVAAGDLPAGVQPGKLPNLVVELTWNERQVTLPPPLDVDRLVFQTRQYRDWQYHGTTEVFSFTDAEGNKYEVKTAGKSLGESLSLGEGSSAAESKKKKKGSPSKVSSAGVSKSSKSSKRSKRGRQSRMPAPPAPKPRLDPSLSGNRIKMIVSRYRPDGTLEIQTTLRTDGSFDGWLTYGPDGITRQIKVQLRGHEFSPSGQPLIQAVYFYDPDQIRQVQVNARNQAWQEVVVSEEGTIRSRLHEDPTKADKMVRLGGD